MWIYKSSLSYEGFVSSDSDYNIKYIAELEGEYGVLKNENIPPLTRELFGKYARTGIRISYEKVYFRRRTMLRDFALKAWLGDDEAIKLLEKIIKAVSDEFTWALPAHTDRENAGTVIDLFAAETAQTLTEIVSLLKDKLSADIAKLAISEVKRRVLMPFINHAEAYNRESMDNSAADAWV